MKIYTEEEAVAEIIAGIDGIEPMQTDAHGQLIIYTGIYQWSDGTIADHEEPIAATDS